MSEKRLFEVSKKAWRIYFDLTEDIGWKGGNRRKKRGKERENFMNNIMYERNEKRTVHCKL